MKKQLFHPRDFAITIIRCDIAQSSVISMLNEVWDLWKGFLLPEYRENRNKFYRSVLQWTDYLSMPDDFHREQAAINKDMQDFGIHCFQHFYEDFEPISYAKYLWIRLHFILPMGTLSMNFGTFLRNQRLSQEDSEKLLSFARCLDFYHIQTCMHDGSPCNLSTASADSQIIFSTF